MSKEKEIADCVRNFIDKMEIHCDEAAYNDRVYENAIDFIADLCYLAGYYEYEDE